MQHYNTLAILVLIAATIAGVQSACSASVTLSRDTATPQIVEGRKWTTYTLILLNNGDAPITDAQLAITLGADTKIEQKWNLAADGDIFNVTNFGGSLAPGSPFQGAGFILSYTTFIAPTVAISFTGCSPAVNKPSTPPVRDPASDAARRLLLTTASTELERLEILQDSDFVFDFENSVTGVTKSAGGKTVAALPTNFPALIGHGVAMTVGYIGACGINLPHTHPRATEINFIVSGEFTAGFFMENGGRFIGHTLKPGMATVFPLGAIHFEMNTKCEPAMFVAAFNNQDPGVQTTSLSFFGLPSDIVSSSLNISSIQTVEDMAKYLPHNPALALGECRKRCGLE